MFPPSLSVRRIRLEGQHVDSTLRYLDRRSVAMNGTIKTIAHNLDLLKEKIRLARLSVTAIKVPVTKRYG